MMGFSEYMLKVNLAIFVAWLLYRIAFRQLTFFRWNRFYLVGSVVLSFILPLLKLPRGSVLAVTELSGFDWEYVDHLVQTPAPFVPETGGISLASLFLAFYLTGVFVVLALNIWRFFRIWKLTRHARPVPCHGVKVFVQERKSGSFTLFRRIYLDKHAYENQLGHVLRHEMVHASQSHSFDLIIMAFVGVLLWFNPFVLLLLRSVRENHEYLADEPVRNEPGELLGYLACLRDETIRRYSPAVASYFKSSTIKKRIIMLTNHHTKNQKRWRYMAALPLIALILLAFQAPVEQAAPLPEGVLRTTPEASLSAGIPSLFPLPEQFKEEITWGYHVKAINPISKKEMVHEGLDIAAPLGTPVYAAAGGLVKKAELLDGWGNLLVIEHSEGYSSFYGHLNGFNVKSGDKVNEGQQVATVGSTGRSTGPHLHYEVRKDGAHMNPADFY